MFLYNFYLMLQSFPGKGEKMYETTIYTSLEMATKFST